MQVPIDNVGNDDDYWNDPAKEVQVRYCLSTLVEMDQEQLQVSSLTEHPEVGGECEVGGDDVEDPAPDAIAGPNLTVIENKVVPEDPGKTAEWKRDEEILVNGDSVTGEAFKLEEDEERRDKKEQGDAKAKQREPVDGNMKV